MEYLPYNKEILTFHGSLNYVVQVWKDDENPEKCRFDQYQPRRNKICTVEDANTEAVKKEIAETIERMKIAINQFQEFIEDKRDSVYFWENKCDL